MQLLLDECNKFATEHMFHYGYDKTKCVVFSPTPGRPDFILALPRMAGCEDNTLDPTKVGFEEQYKYLGVLFHQSLKWSHHAREVLMKGKSKLAQLRTALLNFNMLSPATAVRIMDTFIRSIIRYSCAAWYPVNDTPTDKTAPNKLTKALHQDLGNMYNRTLRTILGLPNHCSMYACKKELGWTDNLSDVMLSKVRLYSRILALDVTRTPRLLLLHRMKSVAYDHAQQLFTSTTKGSSDFVIDVLNTLAATKGLQASQSQLANPHKLTFTDLKVHIPSAVRRYVHAKYSFSFQMSGHNSLSNYDIADNDWSMSSYLSDVQDGNTATAHLVIAQFRCNGHALGSAVQKLYFSRATPHCLCCGSAIQESVMHVLVQCTLPFAANLRRIHLQQVRHAMPEVWKKDYATSTTPQARALLILSAPENADTDVRRTATEALHGWLNSIRHEHPTYSVFTKGKGMKAASVAYTKLRQTN
jgi:hypothetical protein